MTPWKQILVAVVVSGGLVLTAWAIHRFDRLQELQSYGKDALHAAVQAGNIDTARKLISLGANPNEMNDGGQTPLSNFAWCPPNLQEQMLIFMIAAGADPNAAGHPTYTPLNRAIGRDDQQAIRLLRDAGAEIRIWDAIALGDIEQVRVNLILDPACIYGTSRNGETPLMWAAGRGETEIVELLLDSGAEVNALDGPGESALFKAIGNRKKDAARILLAAGADPSIHNWEDQTPMDLLLDPPHGLGHFFSGEELIVLLIESGLPVDYPSKHQRTPLSVLAAYSTTDYVQRVLELGADPNFQTNTGRTPLFTARAGAIPVLVKAGANPNAMETAGRTPLHNAIYQSVKVVEALLAVGADPTLSAPGTISALEEARQGLKNEMSVRRRATYHEIVKLMEAAVAEPETEQADR